MNIRVKTPYRNVLVFCVYAVFILTLIFTTKTVYSGFQLIDDHLLIGLNNRLHHESFLSTLSGTVKEEFYLRFRPLTILNYVAISKWIYPDFFLLALIIAFQGIFTCYFFYRFARQLKCQFIVSFLFPLFILCGNQGAIFWRNCVNETLGMLLLSGSLFFLGKTFRIKKFYTPHLFLFSFFLLLATLTKESFIILVPAVIFLKIWQNSLRGNISFLSAAKNNINLIVFFAVIVIAEILIIYYYKSISDHFIEYVDLDSYTFRPANLLISLYRLTITKGYLVAIVPAMLFILSRLKIISSREKDVRAFFLPLCILFLLIIIPQLLLYAKPLIFERYLLPGTMGSALLIIFLQNYIQQHKKTLSILNKTFLPLCTLLLCVQVFLMTRGAKMYAAAGFEARNILNTIIRNTRPNDTILLVATPLNQSDKALSIRKYLNAPIGGNRNNIFIEPVFDSLVTTDPVSNGVITNFATATKGTRYTNISAKKNIKCIAFFENTQTAFFSRYHDMDTAQYRELKVGSFTVLLK